MELVQSHLPPLISVFGRIQADVRMTSFISCVQAATAPQPDKSLADPEVMFFDQVIEEVEEGDNEYLEEEVNEC